MEPSLNITDLVPLIDDRDPQAMFDEWAAAVQASDPTWVPVNGSLETILAEAMCLSVADLIYAVNRLPGVVLQALLALKDIPRLPGIAATGQVRIWFDGERAVTIPFGSRFMIEGIEFTASQAVTVTADQALVPVVCSEVGSLANSILPGTGVDWLDPDPHAVLAATEGAVSGGSDVEDDVAYKNRVATTFIIDSQGLALPTAFVAWTAGQADVSRSAAVDLWDPSSGNDPGEDPGHITIYAHGQGASLDVSRLAEIQTELDARSIANLTVHVEPVGIEVVDIELEVRLAPGADQSIVLPAVEAALRAAISPAVWTWGEDVTPEEIAAIAARVPGVDYATEVTAPATAVELPQGSLPTAGTVTVTVAP